MISGGFDLSDLNPLNYDYSISYLDDNISDVAGGIADAAVYAGEAAYDNVLAPVGGGIRDGAVYVGEAAYDNVLAPIGRGTADVASYWWDGVKIANEDGFGWVAIPVVNLLGGVLLGGSLIFGGGCGKDEQVAPAPQPEQPPQPIEPPELAFPEYDDAEADYFVEVHDQMKAYFDFGATHKVTYPGYTYPEFPRIDPCLPMSQGAYETICYLWENGSFDIGATGNAELGKCENWAVTSMGAQACMNDFVYINPTGDAETNHPEVTFLGKTLASHSNVPEDILNALDDYGTPMRLAYRNPEASEWSKFRSEAMAAMDKLINERSAPACFAVENIRQAVFNVIKMVYADGEAIETPWEKIAEKSDEKVDRGTDWMTKLLFGGSVSEMMVDQMDPANPESILMKLVNEKIKTHEYRITRQKEIVDGEKVWVKYIQLGTGSDAEKMKLVDYLNGRIWEDNDINKQEVLGQAIAAYEDARTRCGTCLPDINDVDTVACLVNLDVNTMGSWEPEVLVAWQLIQLRDGLLAQRLADNDDLFRASGGGGGRRTTTTTTTTTQTALPRCTFTQIQAGQRGQTCQ